MADFTPPRNRAGQFPVLSNFVTPGVGQTNVNIGDPKIITRKGIMDPSKIPSHQVPVYWGRAQSLDPTNPATPEFHNVPYSIPGEWPEVPKVLVIEKNIRYIFEPCNIETQIRVFFGFTGTYTYGQHFVDFHLSITTPPGVYPAEVNEHYELVPGLQYYAIMFGGGLSGSLSTEFGDYNASGSYNNPYPINLLPPTFWSSYFSEAGAIAYGALWGILSGGFTPPVASTFPGVPPVTSSPDGPDSVGGYFERTGLYIIDGIPYTPGGAPPKNYPADSIEIPSGYDVPGPNPNYIDFYQGWVNYGENLRARFEEGGDDNFYVRNYYKFSQYSQLQGIKFPDCIDPHEDNFYGPANLTIIIISKPHFDIQALMTVDKCIELNRKYIKMCWFRLIIGVDVESMAAQGYEPGLCAEVLGRFEAAFTTIHNAKVCKAQQVATFLEIYLQELPTFKEDNPPFPDEG